MLLEQVVEAHWFLVKTRHTDIALNMARWNLECQAGASVGKL